MNTHIRTFEDSDWPRVAEIYQQGLNTRNATFETELPDFATWRAKFERSLLWVTQIDNEIVGWAGLQKVSARKVYAGVMEVTVYIDSKFAGSGIGSGLLTHLIKESENYGVWTLYASIFPENKASIALHEKLGFRQIGYREKIAQLDGVWRNTILFEKRSKIVGI